MSKRIKPGSWCSFARISIKKLMKTDTHVAMYLWKIPFLSVDIFFVNDLIISEFLKTELQGIIPELFQAFQ